MNIRHSLYTFLALLILASYSWALDCPRCNQNALTLTSQTGLSCPECGPIHPMNFLNFPGMRSSRVISEGSLAIAPAPQPAAPPSTAHQSPLLLENAQTIINQEMVDELVQGLMNTYHGFTASTAEVGSAIALAQLTLMENAAFETASEEEQTAALLSLTAFWLLYNNPNFRAQANQLRRNITAGLDFR